MTETIQAISQSAASALISSIWQGLVLASVVGAAIKLAPRTAAALRFILWSTAFLGIVMLPALANLPMTGAPAPATGLPGAAHGLTLDSRWALAIMAAWAALSTARLIALARSAVRVRLIWNLSAPVESTPQITSLLAQAGPRRARLCTSSKVEQPCVIGFFAPRVVVPEWLLEKATAPELEQIVMHEVAHLRRFDDWTNLLQKLALACFPLNPALLWIERRLCADREVACDESVVRATKAPREYAACLTNLAEQRMAHRRSAALSLGAWEHRSQLGARIESILRGESGLSPLNARAVIATLMLATAGGAIKLGGSAQLVSFAAPHSDQPTAQLRLSATDAPHYRNAVFHAPSTPDQTVIQNGPRIARPAEQPQLRHAVKSSPRRANTPAGGVESFIVVTRWQDNAGRQLTVIDRFVRISALPTAPVQAGWFVVQL